MDYKELAEQFWEQGYLHLPGFFTADRMDHLNAMIHDHFGANPDFEHTEEFLEKSKVEVVPWFPQREGIHDFDVEEGDERLDTLTRTILGEGWGKQYCMVMFSKDGSNGQSWHQDCPPDDAGVHNLNRLIYTQDIREEEGGQLGVVPGSHRMGELTVGDPTGDFDTQKVLAPKKGDLVILHGHAWHRVFPSQGGSRSSTNFRAGPQGTPEDITDICVYRNMRYKFSTSEVVMERA
ncbi:phytanoyl-CoA dioxygenase family protein [Maricaulis sp. D1M11]|uniref:phytanoyl-CoA dioxygenase family protein n=1 Tax=Maricaulis sp. D1M11 TaxID=3076117 RepID=UPI0039B4FB5A